MKIGVLGKLNKVKTKTVIDNLCAFLNNLGHNTVSFSAPSEVDNVEVLIVLGGDGAILHSAVIAAKKGIKIIGINYGNLGFLTEYEKNEQEQVAMLINQLDAGECRIVRRSIIQVDILGKTFYALNEIAVQRDNGLNTLNATQILQLEVTAREGTDIISGDGILICTPTGSTAYSLSAGGAILTPEVPVFMLTPICAFSMRNRPIVFSDSEEFTIKSKKGNSIILLDGKALTQLPENIEITIKKAPFTADFPVKDNSDFFAKVKNKLNQ